jgi:DNA-binding Lrp family transcriptional regulator
MAKPSNRVRTKALPLDLDRIDAGILAALQKDGRLSNKELAATVGLAPSSCLERVKRLRQQGVLRGVHADVAPFALGIGLEAIVAIRMRHHSLQQYRDFRTHLLSIPEVVAYYNLTGTQDFLAHVMVRSPEHLYTLLLQKLTVRPEVDRIETSLVFEAVRRPTLPDLRERAG